MNKFFLGAAIGAVAGYIVKMMYDKTSAEEINDDLSRIAARAKRMAKRTCGRERNDAEYVKKRIAYAIREREGALNEISY